MNIVCTHYYSSRRGNIRVIAANIMINTTRTASDKKNGSTPLNGSIIGTSFAIELMTKTLGPTGSVINPTSTTISVLIPNQSFSSSPCAGNSSPAMIGQKIRSYAKPKNALKVDAPSRIRTIMAVVDAVPRMASTKSFHFISPFTLLLLSFRNKPTITKRRLSQHVCPALQ
jgi:hypothetical protein